MTAATTIREQLDEVAGILETTTVGEVMRYVESGNIDAVCEVMTQAGLLQESCGNQGRADAIYTVLDQIGKAMTR